MNSGDATDTIVPTIDVDRCDVCGSSGSSSLFPTRDRLHGLPGRFGLVRCTTCGLVRLSPRPAPSALPRYYPVEDYPPHGAAGLPPAGGDRLIGGLRDALRHETLRGLG